MRLFPVRGIPGGIGFGVQTTSGGGGESRTYAKFINPTVSTSLDASGLVLTRNGDRPSGYTNGAYTDISKSSGKWYFEYTMNTVNQVMYLGGGITGSFTNPDDTASSYPGRGFNGTALLLAWGAVNNWTTENVWVPNYCPVITASGTVVGVLLDMYSKEVSFQVNGVQYATAISGITGAWEAQVALTYIGEQITANFGATPFAYPVPDGYNAGLYEIS